MALPAHAAQIANVKYIHDYITSKEGITVAVKDATPTKTANMKYLLCAIDKANATVSGCPATTYCTNARATAQAVDTTAVASAVSNFVKTGAAAYNVVDYITFSGTQYINTGIVPTYSAMKVVSEYALTDTNTKYKVLFGARNVSNSNVSDGPVFFAASTGTGAPVFFDYWGATRYTTTGYNNTAWHTITVDGPKLYLDGTLKVTQSPTRSGALSQTVWVGAVNNAGSAHHYYVGRVKTFQIYKSGTLIFDGVPVKRISDGKYGYFDKVSKTFKVSGTSTALTGATTVMGYLTATGTTACQ